jgi:phospholipid transport system substrate-binding protein
MKKFIVTIIAVLALAFPLNALAASPLQTVEGHVSQLLAVLGDPALDGPAGDERKKEAIRSISNSLFDFGELSRFALGAGWRSFSAEQQKNFVDLYRQLLESIYMGRLLQYKDEKVVFGKESALSQTRWEVQSHIAAAGGNIPIDYRLVNRDGIWKVYDLVIENASLAKNYRAQFNSILSKNAPDKLLDMLRQKVKDQAAASK